MKKFARVDNWEPVELMRDWKFLLDNEESLFMDNVFTRYMISCEVCNSGIPLINIYHNKFEIRQKRRKDERTMLKRLINNLAFFLRIW